MGKSEKYKKEATEGGFKNNRYIIHDTMNSKERLIIFISMYVIILLAILFFLSAVTYSREITIITINESELEKIDFGFQNIKIINGLFNTYNKGELRLNYEVKDSNLGEIIYVGKIDNAGDGIIYITDFNFPDGEGRWEAKFELKNSNLDIINKKCYEIKFEVNDNVRQVTETEKSCGT